MWQFDTPTKNEFGHVASNVTYILVLVLPNQNYYN